MSIVINQFNYFHTWFWLTGIIEKLLFRCCLLETKHYLTVRALFSLCHCCVWRQPGARFICSSVRWTFLEVPAGSVSHRPAGQPASQATFRFALFLKFSTACRLWRHVYLDDKVSLGHCSSSTDSLVLCVEPVCYHQSRSSRLQGALKSDHQLSCCNEFKYQESFSFWTEEWRVWSRGLCFVFVFFNEAQLKEVIQTFLHFYKYKDSEFIHRCDCNKPPESSAARSFFLSWRGKKTA